MGLKLTCLGQRSLRFFSWTWTCSGCSSETCWSSSLVASSAAYSIAASCAKGPSPFLLSASRFRKRAMLRLRHVRLQATGSSSVRMMYTSSPRKCCSKILFPRLATKLGGQWFEVLLGLAILFSVQFKN